MKSLNSKTLRSCDTFTNYFIQFNNNLPPAKSTKTNPLLSRHKKHGREFCGLWKLGDTVCVYVCAHVSV